MTNNQLREAYDRAFRSLLWRLRPRKLQRGVDVLWRKADRMQRQTAAPVDESLRTALDQVYRRARTRVIRHLVRSAQAACCDHLADSDARPQGGSAGNPEKSLRLLESHVPWGVRPGSPDFHCDAALGGLARWLRAAGYDAAWWPGIADDLLLAKTLASNAIMLTTDGRLADRGVVVRGVVAACLVPNSLTKREQFLEVFRRLDLPRKPPRCMACGGRLEPVEKESVRQRIPLRTYPWRDDYYQCRRCQKLYWEGTHWQRIEECLGPGRYARQS